MNYQSAMKPRLRMARGKWACFVGRYGWFGESPQAAYDAARRATYMAPAGFIPLFDVAEL